MLTSTLPGFSSEIIYRDRQTRTNFSISVVPNCFRVLKESRLYVYQNLVISLDSEIL